MAIWTVTRSWEGVSTGVLLPHGTGDNFNQSRFGSVQAQGVFGDNARSKVGTKSIRHNALASESRDSWRTALWITSDAVTNIDDQMWLRFFVYVPTQPSTLWKPLRISPLMPNGTKPGWRLDGGWASESFSIANEATGQGYYADSGAAPATIATNPTLYANFSINDYQFKLDQWNVVDWYMKLSTAGAVRLWVNERLLFNFSGAVYGPTYPIGETDIGSGSSVSLFNQYGATSNNVWTDAVIFTTDPAQATKTDPLGNKFIGDNTGTSALQITMNNPAVTNITTTSAMLNWSTNLAADTQAKWGTTVPLQNQSTLDPALVTTHAATMSPLTPGAIYSYQAQSKQSGGQLVVSTNGGQTFATPTAAVPIIIDEQFLGNTQAYYEARGWYDGTNSINQAMILENDIVLNKQVIYARWANVNEPSANGGSLGSSASWRYMRDRNNLSLGWVNGVSFWSAIKFTNYIDVANSYLGHGMFRMIQNIASQFASLNSNGYILVDPQRGVNSSYWYLGEPSASQQCNYVPSNYVRNDHNVSIAWGLPERHIIDSCQNGWLHDNVWYEICGYVKPSVETGQNANSAVVKLFYRRYGVQTWTPLVNANGINMVTNNPGIINQLTTCGPYSHLAQYTSTTQRMYLGWLTYYHGDAIASQTIQGFGPGGTPRPGPSTPSSARTTYNQVL